MTAVDTGFALRPFYCPVEPAVHEAVEEIEARALDWVDRFALGADERERRRIAGTRSAEFYARFAPRGLVDNLEVAVLWVYWGFAFDDAVCDRGPVSDRVEEFLPLACRVQRALEVPDGLVDDDPYAAAVHDIGRRMREVATPVQVQRFIHAHRLWLMGVAAQISNRAAGRMPDLDSYLLQRLGSAGGAPTLALLEIAYGQPVPAHEMDSPVVRALTELSWAVASLDNDLHSYRREVREGYTGQNVITVVAREDGCSVEQAHTRAVALRDRMMQRFLALREEVLARASPALGSYLAGLGHGIRGNIDWALSVPRYTGAEHGTAGEGRFAAESGVTSTPSVREPGPPGLPSVDWWWHVDPG